MLNKQILQSIAVYFGDRPVSLVDVLQPGGANLSYKIRCGEMDYVLKVCRRGQLSRPNEKLYRLISSQIAVPELVHADLVSQPYPIALFRFVTGTPLDRVFSRDLSTAISGQLGSTLARIHGLQFKTAGFFGQELEIEAPFEEGSSPYGERFFDVLQKDPLVRSRLGAEFDKVGEFAASHRDYFPRISKRGMLVHSDFKPCNLLWNDHNLTVLDWEFAHAGHPLLDFAILLRHYDQLPLQIDVLETAYIAGGGSLPEEWIKRARLTDFCNLVQLMQRVECRELPFLLRSLRLTMEGWESLDMIIRKGSVE